MKSRNSAFTGSLLLLAALLFLSCRKQITEPEYKAQASEEIAASSQAIANNCKPVVLGGLFQAPDGSMNWTTLMQKWYDENGRLAYLKTNIPFEGHSSLTFFALNVPWGQVTYEGNEVIFRDVLANETVMRVTLDAQQMPAASYMNAVAGRGFASQTNVIDSSYYFYTGTRLDSMHSSRTTSSSTFQNTLVFNYVFSYDSHGNILSAKAGNIMGSNHVHFSYNYDLPVSAMAPSYQVTMSLKLMQYLELIEFPVSHMLTSVVSGGYWPGSSYPNEVFPVYEWRSVNPVISGGGLVYSYATPDNQRFYYTGWKCGAATYSKNLTSYSNTILH